MRPLRTKTKVLADEYVTESPNKLYILDQEKKVSIKIKKSEELNFLNNNLPIEFLLIKYLFSRLYYY
jgi:hypothetical protein